VYYSNDQGGRSKVAMALEPFPSQCLVMPQDYRCDKQGKGAESAYKTNEILPIFFRLNLLCLHRRFDVRLQVKNEMEKNQPGIFIREPTGILSVSLGYTQTPVPVGSARKGYIDGMTFGASPFEQLFSCRNIVLLRARVNFS
jgi:hypothetical protein